MAPPLKDRKLGTLVLIVLLGIIMGAFMSALVEKLPGGENVVKTFFTYPVEFGLGEAKDGCPGSYHPIPINLIAIKFQFGIQFKFTMLSIIGVFLSLYFFRWYR